MMKRLLRILVLFGLSALAVSCNLQEMDSHGQSDDHASIIRFSASYPLVQTRASDAGFMDGDMMGVYVVDYVDNQPGTLATQGNRADNVRFTFDQGSASWNGTTDIYWKDRNTPVDIYGYYPFDAELSNVTDYKFSVSTYQDDAPESGQVGSYEASDLLWAKAVEVYPTDATVTLTYGHMLSCVRVKLQMGDGFEASQWNELNKVVMINNTITDASVDLSTGIALPECFKWRCASLIPTFVVCRLHRKIPLITICQRTRHNHFPTFCFFYFYTDFRKMFSRNSEHCYTSEL